MRVYVAGPISGTTDAAERFGHATRLLRAAGYDAVNPMESTDPETTYNVPESFRETEEYRSIVMACLEQVRTCDAICMLTGWQASRGACAEKALANALGLLVTNIDNLLHDPPPVLRWTGSLEFEPRKSYKGDAGFDLVVSESVYIDYGGFRDVPMGISVELPEGVWGMLTGRSSTIRNRRVLVSQGIIDNGFRGELFAGCQNVGEKSVQIAKGERIAQLILFNLVDPATMSVEKLSPSERGTSGFGSSGA